MKMKYPCVECIVDAICSEACQKYNSYLEKIDSTKSKKLPDIFINSEKRCRRAISCNRIYNTDLISYKLYTHINVYIRKYFKTRKTR